MIPIYPAYLHSIDPFLVEFSRGIGIRWYGMAYLTGFLAVYLSARWLAKKGRTPLTKTQATDFVFAVALGTIIGGRLGYCVFYNPSLLTEFNSDLPFWGALRIGDGGMASHGGMIGIIAGAWYFSWRHSIPVLHLLDLAAIGGTLGVFFGRIANFINGELVGRICPTNFPLATKFPQDLYQMVGESPETLKALAPAVEQVGITGNRWLAAIQGVRHNYADWKFVQDGIDRLITAIQSGQIQIGKLVEPILSPRYPSQLFEAVLEGLLPFSITVIAWRRPRKPGLVFALFLLFYPVARIIGEQFREPDSHIGYQLLGLTRGQILSGIMLALALIFFAWWRHSKQPEI